MGKSTAGPKVQSLEQYLGKRGLNSPISDYMIDKMRIPHGLTRRQNEKMLKEATQAARRALAKRGIDWKTGKKLKK